MTRLLVFGLCPLPTENTSKNFGPGIRAWQFIKPLLETGTEITLIAQRIPFIYPEDTPDEVIHRDDCFTYYNFSEKQFLDIRRIQEIHDRFQPDAILAATIFASSPLKNLNTECPVWIDLFGHVMAEAQAKVFRYNDNSFIDHFLKHEIQALKTGDIFSTVSKAQGFATVGELGLLKRLTAETTGYEFCHTIPCAMDPELYTHDRKMVRGTPIPEDDFIILWSGGYNTWTDIETLFDGLEYAMARNDSIWFVSTGGQIDGHDEITYPAFLEKIRQSRFRDRFIMQGWINREDVHNYYFEANIGINIDRFMYEGMFGSKNRVLDWLRAGLPSLIGELCELSYELPKQGLAYSYPLGDAQKLGETILSLAATPKEVAETGRKAQAYGLNNLTFHKTTESFRNWLDSPLHAPDSKSSKCSDPPALRSHQQLFDESLYLKSLETDVASKKAHIVELERYIRHLEDHIRDNPSSAGVLDTDDTQRPSMTPRALILPETPLISVVVVVWNGVKYIDECLQSVITQEGHRYEIIVIDNCSQDGSAAHICDNYPDITLIRNSENLGFTRGVNQGIEIATGDIVYLLNQDAILQPDHFTEIIQGLNDHETGIAGCKILYPESTTLQHAGGILHDNGLTDHYGAGEDDTGQFDEDRDVAYVTGAAFAIKRSLIDEIGVFDPRYSPAYFEELDYCLRTTRAGYRIRYLHKAVAFHHESTSTGKFSQRFYYLYHRNRLKFILKHYSARYMLGTFRRFELNWMKQHMPREQVLPLIKAYLRVCHRFIWVVIRSLKNGIKK